MIQTHWQVGDVVKKINGWYEYVVDNILDKQTGLYVVRRKDDYDMVEYALTALNEWLLIHRHTVVNQVTIT